MRERGRFDGCAKEPSRSVRAAEHRAAAAGVVSVVPGSGKAGNLAQQMETLVGDPAVKARIVRFLHTHSHMEQVSDPEHDLSVLSEAPAVLTDMLALIEANDKGHYEAMMKIA